ncbi:MAG: hypothetical protein ACO35B_06450 [Luminiphilus sp.]
MPRSKGPLPAKIGRPTLYSEEVAQRICDELSEGKTLIAITSAPDMPDWRTVYRWMADNRHFVGGVPFREASARAREEEGTHALAEQALAIADRDDLDPAHKRVMIDTRLRLIGQWNRRVYGDTRAAAQVTVNHNVATVNVAALSQDSRDALERALIEAEAQES